MFEKGVTGNPNGRPRSLSKLARQSAESAILAASELLKNPDVEPELRLRASELILKTAGQVPANN